TSTETSSSKEEDDDIVGVVENDPIKFFEQNQPRPLSEQIKNKIKRWTYLCSAELVIEAMKMALLNGVDRWHYVEAILCNWSEHDIYTIDDVKAFQKAYK